MKEAAKFAETTQILMNVSEFTDVSQATDTLISSVQAFGYTAETSMDVVDLLNTIGNNYAISTADLAQSLTKSSASLVAAGGDLAEAAALTATANKIIQDADSVGTALKTTSLRLRGTDVKVLEEEGLDSDGAVTSKSKLQGKVKALSGVDILTATGEYKSTYEILSDIADVWESINDMDQAALLELISGKRNSSVIAAILQNPEELKAAFEDANNAEGSAAKELEKYLDSIQGKIDQFTNSVQSLWSNILDDDWVKTAVSWATEIIKSLNTTEGQLRALVKVVALLMAYKKVNPLDWITKFSDISKAIKTDGLKSYIMSLFRVSAAQKTVTADTMVGTIAQQQNDLATQQQIVSKLGLTNATGALTAAQKLQAAQELVNLFNGGMISKDLATRMAAMLGYKFSVDATNGATVALDTTTKSFMASNPVGWILLIVSAIVSVVMWISSWNSATEDLTEELNDLKSELQDIQSELDSVNQELETTNDRMAELLAKDSLSFVEKEELNNLKNINEELQRELDLLESEKKLKTKQTAQSFSRTMHSDLDDKEEYYVGVGEGEAGFWSDAGAMISGVILEKQSESDHIKEYISEYEKIQEEIANLETQIIEASKKGESTEILEREKGFLEDDLTEIETYMSGKIDEFKTRSDGLEYYVGDDLEEWQIEANEWLDYINNTRDAWAIVSGSENAKSNAISNKFNKKEYASISDSINGYVEALQKGDVSARQSIENIIKNNDALVKDLEDSGVAVNDAVDYFTSFASNVDYTTVEGKVKEMDEATSRLSHLVENVESKDFIGPKYFYAFFDEDGNVLSERIAEYFGGENGGLSSETQAEIEYLIKQIYDGKISVENALKQFEYFGIESTLDIYIAEVQTNFKDVFIELEDVDGFIDTFKELGEAIGSTADALKVFNKAEAEMANSGRVSIETALQLMEYTDDYGSILQVVDGKLQLVDGAEETLIQTRINAIKTSAEASLSDATNAYNKAQLATQTYKDALTTNMSSELVANSWDKVLAAGAGLMAGIKSLVTGETWTEAYNRAYDETLSNITGYETSYDDAGLQSLVDAEEKAKKAMDAAQDRVNLANQLTPETLESINDADDVDNPDDVKDDAFQREMDYWENRLSANQARADRLENTIDLLEQKGMKASAQYYRDQMTLLNSVDPNDGVDSKLELLNGKLAAVVSRLKETTDGSEEWWEAAQEYNDIVNEIQEIESAIVDMQDAIAEIDTYKFEEFNTRLDNLTSKLETIRNLIAPNGEEDWFDDEGNWTEAGVAYLATYIQDLADFNEGLTRAKEEYTKYTEEYAGNEDDYANLGIHSEQELYDKREELIEQQYDYAESINDTEQSVVDMYESNIDAIEEYTETLIDSYNDYIDSVKEALSAEKDLYEFKKNVQKQSKDIAELERRIASLSGSTNKSEIAERRKLEAQLYEARESLNDTYYDHAKDAQSEALDAEATAYEETMNKFIEGLRIGLETATRNMDEFLMSVTSMVTLNADTVLQKYQETELPLSDAITNPWEAAKKAVGNYSGDALELMNTWTQNGFLTDFPNTVENSLESPWKAGQTAVGAFTTSVDEQMKNVVSAIETNVKNASTKLSELYKQIEDTETRAASVKVDPSGNGGGGGSGSGNSGSGDGGSDNEEPTVKLRGLMQTSKEMILGSKSFVDANTETINGVKYYRDSKTGYYYKISDLNSRRKYDGGRTTGWAIPKGTWFYTKYAKGTTGTTRDQWAITDEPQFGDELVLVPGKDGNLSFMRKGTGVVPAALTEELMKLGEIGVDRLMNTKQFGANINMISNAVNKPEFTLNVDNFLRCDNVSQDSLPELKQFVKTEMNNLVKQMNYSLKGKGAR